MLTGGDLSNWQTNRILRKKMKNLVNRRKSQNMDRMRKQEEPENRMSNKI